MKNIGVAILAVAASIFLAVSLIRWIHHKHHIPAGLQWFYGILLTVLFCWIEMIAYLSNYYHADPGVQEYLQSSGTVTVSETENGYYFDGPGTESAIIFYPGAKVEETAYAPLLYRLAENGEDCFLVRMPYRMAFFKINAADSILESRDYDYQKWYMMGHSLGGVAASSYAAVHSGITADSHGILTRNTTDTGEAIVSGVIFLASYPTESMYLPTLSIYGSEDGILNRKAYQEAGQKYFEGDKKEVIIGGGNHAQFGDYGEQRGDGTALITAAEQQEETSDQILQWLERHLSSEQSQDESGT